MTSTITVWATHRVVGFHGWPDAPLERSYLGVVHRHLFGVRAELDTTEHVDSARVVEFHDVIDVLAQVYADGHDFGTMSCEQIAREYVEALRGAFGERWVRVSVDEDGECGGTFTWQPE